MVAIIFACIDEYVKNFVKGSSTSLKFNDIQVDTGVSDNLFHEKNLKRIAQW